MWDGYGLDEIIEMDGLTQQMLYFSKPFGGFHDDALATAVKKAHFGMGIEMKGSTPSRF